MAFRCMHPDLTGRGVHNFAIISSWRRLEGVRTALFERHTQLGL